MPPLKILPPAKRSCAESLALRAWSSAYHRSLSDARRLAELEHYPGLRPGYKSMARRAIQSYDTVRQARILKDLLREITRVELSRQRVRKAYPELFPALFSLLVA